MPIFGPGFIRDANIPLNADIDPLKMLFTAMGCWMRKTTPQSITDATLTAVTFADGETFDAVPAGGTELHSTSTNPSRITLRRAGIWLAVGLLSYEGATGTGSGRYAYIIKNGVTTVIAPSVYVTVASQPVGVLAAGFIYTATNTEYIELGAYHGQGSNVNVGDYGSGTFFGACWMGDNT
jgi:hypothetical protein